MDRRRLGAVPFNLDWMLYPVESTARSVPSVFSLFARPIGITISVFPEKKGSATLGPSMNIDSAALFTRCLIVLLICWLSTLARALDRDEVLEALRKGVAFYSERAAIEGGYHDVYSSDLSVAQSSKRSRGHQQISVTGSATPSVGMAFLVAWDATKDSFYLEAARRAGHALLRGQLCSGGWDYSIHLDPEKRIEYRYRQDVLVREPMDVESAGYTNLDNNSTQAAIRFLMRLDRELQFVDAAIHEGALFALRGLVKGQYPNGAWPQRYRSFPDRESYPVMVASFPGEWPRTWPGPVYYRYYTINDECTLNMIDVLLEANRIYANEAFLRAAFRGGEFLLLAQLPEPQPAWAQQYNSMMQPVWGRQFEPPAVSGRESLDVIRTLLLLFRELGDARFLDPVPKALDYFERSMLNEESGPITESSRLARFYEMGTNRPLFLTKGTRLELQTDPWRILDGYAITYDDSNTVSHYTLKIGAQPLVSLRAEYERVKSSSPEQLRRPSRLLSLTPWRYFSGTADPSVELDQKVTQVLSEMDSRGAWVQPGEIGLTPRVLSVTAGATLTLIVDGQQIRVDPDQSIQLFQGTKAPIKEVVRSGTFNANVRLLCEVLTVSD